jgi:asparagine synthase (glutamine-hydrolysing)
MCGIAGYVGSFQPQILVRANQLQSHRGPDAEGVWIGNESCVGLGHSRLSIIDLTPTGAQPMLADEDSVVLVFNGEIYNFRELRAELESKGHRFRGQSDSEVLLQLYVVEGESMLRRLNGIFALAIWDARRRSLLVARDALGVKPLYFGESGRGFAFASELKALIHLLPEARELDPASLHRYLSFLWCPGEGTPLRSIRRLAPGNAMLISENGIVRRWTWYELPVFSRPEPKLTEESAIRSTVEHLRRAVHRQLVADVPVGAFLSGGLDSSAVVAFAREKAPQIQCFTIDSVGDDSDGFADDLPYARRVAAHLQVPLHVLRVDAKRMAADVEGMIKQLDEPLADPAALNVLYISRLAREHGMKVLLSGAGGDDLYTGYRRHVAMNYESYWRWLPRSARAGLKDVTTRLDQRRPGFRRLKRLFDGAKLEGDARIANYFLWTDESQLFRLYTPEFKAELGTTRATEPMIEFLRPLPQSVGSLDRMLALEQRFFLSDHNFTYTDRMSMAAGVEVRVPFLDLELVENAARIPIGLKQRGRTGKWILKKAMEPYLPHDVIYRPKSGFGAPLRRWMRGELRPLVADVLSAESLERRGLFDSRAVHRLISQNDSGEVDAAYTLLSLLSIEIWCRSFLDTAPGNRHAGD